MNGKLSAPSSCAPRWRGETIREVLPAVHGTDELAAELLAAFVAAIGGRIVGFANHVTKVDLEAEMEELFIEPGEWRMGIGTQLLKEAERRAIVAGARRLRVAANPPGLRLSTKRADSM